MIIIASFLVLGISSLLLQTKVGNKYIHLTTFLWICSTGLFLQDGFHDSKLGTMLVAGLLIFSSVAVILSSFIKHQIGALIPIILSFGYLYFGSEKIEFLDYPLLFDFKNLMIVVLAASILPHIAILKVKLVGRFFTELELEKGVYYALMGMVALIALFFGETFGLFIAGVSVFNTELFINQKKEHKLHGAWLLLTVSSWMFVYKNNDFEMVNAFHYSFLYTLIIGAGIGMMLSKSFLMKHGNVIKAAILFVVTMLIFSAIAYASTVKEHLGGFSGMFAFVLGFSLVSNLKNSQLNLAYQSTFVGVCLLFLPSLKPLQEENNLNTEPAVKQEAIKQEVLTSKDFSEIIGSWKINSTHSNIAFELGPKDSRTKGAFKMVEGIVDVTENIENTLLSVTVPMKGFTTFNSFRDEGLMDEAYFDVKKFPMIRFDSKKVVKTTTSYTIEGEAIMKGIKQKMTLEMYLIETGKDDQGEFAKLSGKSSIDRSKHAMESDPKIGDLVDFTFNLELRK